MDHSPERRTITVVHERPVQSTTCGKNRHRG